jgi:hypothetical protein
MWWHSWTLGLWHSMIVYIDWKESPVTCREETVNEETASPTTGHETAISCASGGPTTQFQNYQEGKKLMPSEISCFLAPAFRQVRAVFMRLLYLVYPTDSSMWVVSYTDTVKIWPRDRANGNAQDPDLRLVFYSPSCLCGEVPPTKGSRRYPKLW